MEDEVTKMLGTFSLLEVEQRELEIPEQKMEENVQSGRLCLVGKLISDRLVSKETIRTALIRKWRPLGTLSFKVLGENLFLLLEFEYEEVMSRVLEGRPWDFEGTLFSIEAFDGLTPPTHTAFKKTVFWVRILNLPLACMNKEV
jgi:hypothetical protein